MWIGCDHGCTRAAVERRPYPKLRKRKRRASAVACGSERGAFAHEFRKVAVDDAVALLDGIVAREDVLRGAMGL